jgi:hypothetical protein
MSPRSMSSSVRAAVRRAIVVAAVVWLVFSVGVVLSNVVFARVQGDDGVEVLAAYSLLFVAFMVTGRHAARVGGGSGIQALSGAVAGTLIGSFTAGTFFAVDNIFLSIVATQQSKIDGFAHSGMTSMREYLNHDLIGPLVFWTVAFGVFGAVFAMVGGATVWRNRVRQAPS